MGTSRWGIAFTLFDLFRRKIDKEAGKPPGG